MHKHFRMLSISMSLSSQGYTASSAPHTRIVGIWDKLGKEYGLDALDEREDAMNPFLEPDPMNPEDAAEFPDFGAGLEENDEYRQLIWERAFRAEQSPTPPQTDLAPSKGTPPPAGYKSQVPPEELEDKPAEGKSKGAKQTRGKNTRSAKAAQMKRGQKEQSVASSSAAEEEEEEEEDEDEDEEDEEEDDESTAGKGSVRGRGTRKKPAPKRPRRR